MRVHELAKDLRLTSKQLVGKLQDVGIEVKSTLSTLTEDQVAKAREALGGGQPKGPSQTPAPRSVATVPSAPGGPVRGPGRTERRIPGPGGGPARPTAPAPGEARRPNRAAVTSAAAAIADRMRRSKARVTAPEEPRQAAPGPSSPTSPTPTAPTAVEEKPRQPRAPRGRGAPAAAPAGPDLTVPTIEVMRIDDQQRRPGAGKRRGAKGRGDRRGPEAGTELKGAPRRSQRVGDRIAPSFVLPDPPSPLRGRSMTAQKHAAAPKIIRIQGDMTVGQFSQATGIAVPDLMKSLLGNHGQMLTLNQTLPMDLMELLALEFNVEISVVPESDENDISGYIAEDDDATLVSRPPVVTVMGHVDHGKTSLLDAIRETNVAEGEFGGITQHIGAYLVETPKGRIAFLDTPGHEAFTAMRARGARVTDIVVLVVAADDPIMPQTIEAINHAKEAGVPIIVAINKIDLPGANVQRITYDLMGQGLVPDDQGGDTIFARISAKQRQGIDKLLEAILLQSEILELKANPNRSAVGVIIESRNDAQRGAVSTALVQRGTLRIGDSFVVGQQSGRVKAMFDDRGTPVAEAGPSIPVEILGVDGVPEAGDVLLAMADERKAREIAALRSQRRRSRGLDQRRHVSLEGLKDMVEKGKVRELRLILKADVQGSLEAVRQSLERIIHDEIKVRILHAGVGAVSESDVDLADASDAVIIGFHVRPDPEAALSAQRLGIDIKTYQIIYDLVDEVKAAMAGLIEKRYKEILRGRAEVREVFHISKMGNIAGSFVSSGEFSRQKRVRLVRDSVVIYDGRVANLRRFKDDVSSVTVGLECGIGLQDYNDIKAGDVLEAYDLEEIPITL